MSAPVQPNIVPYVIFPTFGLLLITKRYAGDKVGTKIGKMKEFFEFHHTKRRSSKVYAGERIPRQTKQPTTESIIQKTAWLLVRLLREKTHEGSRWW